jgi:hypothetical protein
MHEMHEMRMKRRPTCRASLPPANNLWSTVGKGSVGKRKSMPRKQTQTGSRDRRHTEQALRKLVIHHVSPAAWVVDPILVCLDPGNIIGDLVVDGSKERDLQVEGVGNVELANGCFCVYV